MDRARLDESISEMTAAEAAYRTALEQFADATVRATRNPLDRTAARELQVASGSLTAARTRVTAARAALDAIRAAELSSLSTADQLLGSIQGNQVLSLFPVGLEARLEPGRLRVRVWPDAISTSTHDPRLTEKELAATKEYWRAEVHSNGEEASLSAWRVLCGAIGSTRAAWTARLLTPTGRTSAGEPLFPTVAMQDDAAPFVPRASVLPDRWIVIGLRDQTRVVEHVGASIPMDLAVGIDTTPTETATLTNREGEPIQLPSRMRWMTDFATAVQVGMAFDIPVAADVDHLDELLVLGVRITQTAAQNADTLAELFTGHRFSRGFAFVPQNTPTNNSVTGGSGLPSGSARVDMAFQLERRPRAFPSDAASNGVTAALAFGLSPDVFAPIFASGATADIATEPDGFEPEAADPMQTVLWQVTLGSAIEDFLLLSNARGDSVREYFRKHVRAAGPVPAVRVGRQPYGVLPVTTLTDFTAGGDEGIDTRLIPLLRAARVWFAMLRQSPLFDGSPENALHQLGRSTQLFAETTQQQPASTGDNRWASLAHSLAIASRNSIRDTWRNTRIRATVEGIPQPVTRPIVDAGTTAELAALAAALPQAILARAVPSSVLARLARQAALLEWSRFARGACEASIDEASREDLAQRAATSGSDVYINVLVQAMTERPGPPVIPPIVPPIISRARKDDDPTEPPEPPEPPDPPDPPDPPQPPIGDVAVNAEERQRIRTLVGSLGQPLASCPGAARLASFRHALGQLARFPAARLESEMFGVLDITNHRLDAWFTSLASRRLTSLRAATPTGVVIGGWGYLQSVQRADPSDPKQRAEFIHTPSLDQAAAAAVLRSGARRAQGAGSSHADIDLSSRRVRLARWVLEGVRNGRSLSELLGVRFERTLKDSAAATELGHLRALFPGAGRMSVIDGLALQQSGLPAASGRDVVKSAEVIDETVDALADALTAEAVYQIVKGNPMGALINVESIAAGAAPPELQVTQTPASGIRLTHRVAIVLPATATAPGWTPNVSSRSRAEPLLDVWCGFLLGPADGISLRVERPSGTTTQVPLSALGIAAIDIVFAGRDKGALLAEYVMRAAVGSAPEFSDGHVRENRVWRDLTALCEAIARALTRGEPLPREAFDPPSAVITARNEVFGDLPQRVADATTALTAVRELLLARTNPRGGARRAAAFGIRVPGLLLSSVPTIPQQDALITAIDARLSAAATGTPRDRLRALFGGDLPGVVTFTPSDPQALRTAGPEPPGSLLNGDALAPRAWLDAVGRTHPRVSALNEVLARREIAGDNISSQLSIAQAPWTGGDRWIATSFTSKSKKPPSGRLSVLMHAPAGVVATQPLGGLLIDSWTETIPGAARDTAIALRFNNASTRAPQVILLAVSPTPAQAWSSATLVDIVRETVVLTRLRMQPSTTLSRGGLMPFAWLGQRPGGTGISFSL